jgi:hypothetical protein
MAEQFHDRPGHPDEYQHGPHEVHHPPEGPRSPEVKHERSDVNVRSVLWFAAGLVAIALVVFLTVGWLVDALSEREQQEKASKFPLAEEQRKQGRVLPERPRLEGFEWKGKGSHELRPTGPSLGAADGYGWVDQKEGVARVPVDRAIDRLLESKRLKGPDEDKEDAWQLPARKLPSDANSGRRSWAGERIGGEK